MSFSKNFYVIRIRALMIDIYKSMSVCVCVPYRSTFRSSDCDETFTSYCKHSRGGFGNLKNLKTVLAGVPGVALRSDLDEILHT